MLQIPSTSYLRPGAALQHQERDRAQIREWLLALQERYELTARQLAVKAQVSPSTIYRAIEEDGDFVMSFKSMSKIAGHFGVPLPTAALDSPSIPRTAQQSADLIAPGSSSGGLAEQIPAGHARYRVTSDVLNLEGFRPGDIVEFDLTARPQPGDIVVARVHNMHRNASHEVMRIYQPPYLMTRTTDATIDSRPLYVDNERVVLVGTWARMFRERAS